MKTHLLLPSLLLVAMSWFPVSALSAESGADDIVWLSSGERGEKQVQVYFFWSLTCPHCQNARPFIDALPEQYPWITIHSMEITRYAEHRSRFRSMAAALGQQATSVPAFFLCRQQFVGWDDAEGMGQILLRAARQCRDGDVSIVSDGQLGSLEVPILGKLDMQSISLPVFTLIIAGLDAFNPCAFFILLFLLSLLVHARSRRRMLLVGATFVLISGIIYFLFMAAWLNLFLVIGSLPYITLIAGLLAIIIGGMNAREFFIDNTGPSLSIPESAKPGLFKRMGSLISADRLPTLLLGTVTLAIAVNGYELLCTVGFPMVYTRALTMHQLDSGGYYLYLLMYNLIYVIPLMVIVALFTWTLGARKLSQSEGKLLKLLSGVMMLLLGAVLVIAPERLNNLQTGIGLLLLAVILVVLLWYVKKRWFPAG